MQEARSSDCEGELNNVSRQCIVQACFICYQQGKGEMQTHWLLQYQGSEN